MLGRFFFFFLLGFKPQFPQDVETFLSPGGVPRSFFVDTEFPLLADHLCLCLGLRSPGSCLLQVSLSTGLASQPNPPTIPSHFFCLSLSPSLSLPAFLGGHPVSADILGSIDVYLLLMLTTFLCSPQQAGVYLRLTLYHRVPKH